MTPNPVGSVRIGAGLALMNVGSQSDRTLYSDALRMVDQVERLGFHSIWTVEHHFSGHSPVPNPLHMLGHIAGRTSRLLLGTAVLVLPWHEPIRVAEDVAMLDHLSGGRALIGFGRGTSKPEYEGFRVPIEESRERFAEAVQIIRKALTQERFEYSGRFDRIPEISIRPRPFSHPERRMYGAGSSTESVYMMATLGLGLMISPNRDLTEAAALVDEHRSRTLRCETVPKDVVCHLYVSVDEDVDTAHQRAERHMRPMLEVLDRHYGISQRSLAGVPGYEKYVGKGDHEWYTKTAGSEGLQRFMQKHLIGTPAQCSTRLAEIARSLGSVHFVGEFGYGGMSHADCMKNLTLFAREVVPAFAR